MTAAHLFIARHGNTFDAGEPIRRIGAGTDLPLVAGGVAQAQALGRYFADAGLRFGTVMAGPLRRTMATAEAIMAEMENPPPLTVASLLNEIHHGPDEGLFEEEVVRRIGAAALARWDREGVAPPPAALLTSKSESFAGRQCSAIRPRGRRCW